MRGINSVERRKIVLTFKSQFNIVRSKLLTQSRCITKTPKEQRVKSGASICYRAASFWPALTTAEKVKALKRCNMRTVSFMSNPGVFLCCHYLNLSKWGKAVSCVHEEIRSAGVKNHLI